MRRKYFFNRRLIIDTNIYIFFITIDRDGNGKVIEKETEYLNKIELI